MNRNNSLPSEKQKMNSKTSRSLKLKYTTPRLKVIGKLAKLTLGAGSGAFDGGTFGRVPS